VGFCGLVPMLLRGNAYNSHSNALYPRPLFRFLIQEKAERVTLRFL
jgi:hypothetical protein